MEQDKINILIIGGGKGGTSLIDLFREDEAVNILGICDVDLDAPGIKLAEKYNIPTAKDWKKFIKDSSLSEIFDVTGNAKVFKALELEKPKNVGLVGGPSSRMIWQLIEQRRSSQEELMKKINSLELFQKVSVGRELKMVELKEKIKELEKRLQER
ncbi:MAG: hypothetical protein ABH848_00620 [Candidatus Omnitrophota bacterium]